MPDTKIRTQQIFSEELFPHMEALKTYAYHLTYNETDADDLVQETYLKAHRAIDNYSVGTNAKAWLFKILKNSYINEYRKKNRKPKTVPIEDAEFMNIENRSKENTYDDPRIDFFDESIGDEVSIALSSLKEEFREVILLCDIEGFTYEEIAETLGLRIGTVRSRLFRARNELKDKLKDYALGLGYKDNRSR